MHLAVRTDNLQLINALAKKGINLSTKNDQQLTASQLTSNPKVKQILKDSLQNFEEKRKNREQRASDFLLPKNKSKMTAKEQQMHEKGQKSEKIKSQYQKKTKKKQGKGLSPIFVPFSSEQLQGENLEEIEQLQQNLKQLQEEYDNMLLQSKNLNLQINDKDFNELDSIKHHLSIFSGEDDSENRSVKNFEYNASFESGEEEDPFRRDLCEGCFHLLNTKITHDLNGLADSLHAEIQKFCENLTSIQE